MLKAFINPSQIVTVNTSGKNFKRGHEAASLNILENHSIIVENDIIMDLIPNTSVGKISPDLTINLKNKVVLPGLIDCHTHTVFAGSRAQEFRLKLEGATYEDIARAGGGINKTVSAVRKTSFEDLVEISRKRIEFFISQGVTSLEIKSGYGLDFENEIKILRVINYLKTLYAIDIVPTFLGAHTFPFDFKRNQEAYMQIILDEMLPEIVKNNLAEFCDAYCEMLDFTPEQIDRIFTRASKLGLKLKLHSEQFNNIGGIDIALKHNVTSIDHLEVINDEDIRRIAATDSVCVVLPGVSFFLHYGYAPVKKLLENNAIVAVATDYNPGSSHIPNLHFVIALAAIEMRMKIEEIIPAVTINAAKAIGLNEKTGSIEIGKKADFAVFNTDDYSDIIYEVGKNIIHSTIKNGNIIYKTSEG